MKTLSLRKDQHHFIVVYEPGMEPKALDLLIEWVNNPEIPFDWFDAAVLSHQLGLSKDLKPFLPKKAGGAA